MNRITRLIPKDLSKKMNFGEWGLANYIKTWVLVGAISGASLSGIHKFGEICSETSPEYVYPLFERPIRGVYHMTRIAGHSGWGAFIGGVCALTAPLSIPLYIAWRGQTDPAPPPKHF